MTKLTGVWEGWEITPDALISPMGRKYKPEEIEQEWYTQADLARALGVTRAAIGDRMRRGTLPPFDRDKMWHYTTIKHLFE